MHHIVAFSGGAASSVAASLVLAKHPGAVLLYHSTRSEPADNDRFRVDVAVHLGAQITEDSDGRDIWQVCRDKKMIANNRVPFCSHVLKAGRGQAYVSGRRPCRVYYGFGVDEAGRAQRTASRLWRLFPGGDVTVCFPLIEARLTSADCHDRVTECWGLRLPEMYEWADHANCVPCFRGGLAYWGQVYLNAPEAWERAAVFEECFGHTILKPRYGFLRDCLARCLELAAEWRKKRAMGESQLPLFALPCECG